MREKINDNPLAQAGLIGVLLVAAALFLMRGSGGGGEEEESSSASGGASVAVVASAAAGSPTDLPPPGTGVGAPPPLPAAVTSAYEAGDTVVLLFVRDGGIDDRRATAAVDNLSMPRVVTFVVPASKIARYAAIAQGADVNRVPALVVLSPKRVDGDTPKASVHYGYQSVDSVEQAVIDAGYKGPTLPYHP
ncbi:MAG TPA: hypothetical protein VF245_10695 [Solirubrobacterales bacterium]